MVLFRRAFVAFALSCFAWLSVGLSIDPARGNCTTPCTKAQIATDIATNWPDNTGGSITPALLRSTVLDLVNSYIDTNGAASVNCGTHQFLTAIATLSTYSCAQPAIADISGFGTGVATALGVNIGSAGAPALFNGAGGTPTSLTLTNATGLPIGGGGTGQTTALAARGTSGLAVETQSSNGDSAFGIPATAHTAVTSAAFTTSRVWTLPAANAVNAGHTLDICDQAQALTAVNSMVVTAAGADTIIGHNGSTTTITLSTPGVCLTLKSDGSSKWNNPASMVPPSIQVKTSGSGTITTPLGVLYCKARLIGGGAGGAGSGTTPTAATAGTATTLGALTANGGALGSTTAGTTAAGGTSSGCNILNLQGGPGGGSSNQNQTIGGAGGQSFFGGGSAGGFSSAAPTAAMANSGGGGGGGGQQAAVNGGGGGGAGGYCEHIYTNPISATFSYAVGPGGNAGGAGTGGTVGAAGGSGWIEFACYFQ